MAWQEPKTNWDSAGNPLPADFNRIEENTQYLQDNKITNAGGVPQALAGYLASRPSPGIVGRLFIATDINTVFRDNGSEWKVVDLKYVQPGDTILLGALTERSVTASSVMVKQFRVMRPGRYRITGELRTSYEVSQAHLQVLAEEPTISYEDVVLGTFSTSSTSYVSFSIDFGSAVSPGALIKINLSIAQYTAYIRNVRVRYGIPAEPVDIVIQN